MKDLDRGTRMAPGVAIPEQHARPQPVGADDHGGRLDAEQAERADHMDQSEHRRNERDPHTPHHPHDPHDPHDRSGARAMFYELRKLPDGSAERAELRNALVRMHLPLVEHLARRFRNRGEPLDDLTQVATIGLIKSVDRFDPDRGVEFSTYATPTVVGEIKRHFRDKGWAVRVPRRLQELRLSLTTATAELSQRHGRAPTVHELAEHLAISEEEVLEGLESANAYSTLSLDVPDTDDESPAVADTLGAEDEALEGVEYRESLKPLLEDLPPREKKILLLRFRQHDPVADRPGGRHLADARLPPAGPHPGPAPRQAPRGGVSEPSRRRPPPRSHQEPGAPYVGRPVAARRRTYRPYGHGPTVRPRLTAFIPRTDEVRTGDRWGTHGPRTVAQSRGAIPSASVAVGFTSRASTAMAATARPIPAAISAPPPFTSVHATGNATIWVISEGPRLQRRRSHSPRAATSGSAASASTVRPPISAWRGLSGEPARPTTSM
ncbi:RNA polymerase sigma factor RpoD [Streptomyces rimosus subsp. rimosus]